MAAEAAGLRPIKLNAVVTAGYNESDVVDLARLTLERDWHVRFIELMPLGGGECATVSIKRYVSNIETRRRIEASTRRADRMRVAAMPPTKRAISLCLMRGRRRLYQPGQRALLWHLQPDAADGRRQIPSMPAQ